MRITSVLVATFLGASGVFAQAGKMTVFPQNDWAGDKHEVHFNAAECIKLPFPARSSQFDWRFICHFYKPEDCTGQSQQSDSFMPRIDAALSFKCIPNSRALS